MQNEQISTIGTIIIVIVLYGGLLLAGISLLIKSFLEKRRIIIQSYKYAAQELGLMYKKRFVFLSSIRMSGELEGQRIETSMVWDKLEKSISIRINYDLSDIGEFRLAPKSSFSMIRQKPGFTNVQIGDGLFDKKFDIEGNNEMPLISFFNYKIRETLLELLSISGRFEITEKMIVISLSIEDRGHAPIADILHIAHAARLMTEVPDFRNRLTHNALYDTNSAYREYNLELLASQYPDDPDTILTLKKALQDRNQRIQIFAARLLQDEGRSVMLEMIKDRKVTAANFPLIVTYFEKTAYKDCIPSLMEYFKHCTTWGEKIGIIKALGVFGDGIAQSFLLEVLEKEKHPEMKTAVIRSLGSCGSLEAVEALFRVRQSASYYQIKNEIQQAIVHIQDRNDLQGEKGWLSLRGLTEEEGGLSISNAEDGALSMAEEE